MSGINGKILWPFGAADVLNPADAANIEVSVSNNLTIINIPAMGGNRTLDIDADPELRPGALLMVNVDQGATARNLALGTGLLGQELTGVINDKDTLTFVWDGAVFRQVALVKNVDA